MALKERAQIQNTNGHRCQRNHLLLSVPRPTPSPACHKFQHSLNEDRTRKSSSFDLGVRRAVAGVPTRRSLARSPLAATGMAARLGINLQSLAPALRFHLQASSKRTYAYTTRSHRTPPAGVQSQGTHFHCSHAQTRHNAGKRILA